MLQDGWGRWRRGGVVAGAAFAAADNALLPRNLSPWGMFMGADIVVKAVMVGLAFASLVTWTVWLAKTIELRRQASLAKRRVRLLESDTTLCGGRTGERWRVGCRCPDHPFCRA